MAITRTRYNRIKVVLAEKGKSNNDLAEFLGVEASTVSNYVTNARQPTVERLFVIAKFLGVEARELISLNNDL